MSILFKGVEMPESCSDCFLDYDSIVCMALNKEFPDRSSDDGYYAYCSSRMPDCPLIEVPQHGGLIDINALKLAIVNVDYVNKHDYLKGVLSAINNAPTVIPADKDGET